MLERSGGVVVCICRRPLLFVDGWDGCSTSPVDFPGLEAIVLWSFGGLPFVASCDEQRSYLVGGGGRCQGFAFCSWW